MNWVIVDVEADGPIPGHGPGYSMAAFAAILVTKDLPMAPMFKSGLIRPISPLMDPNAIAVHGLPYEQREKEGRDPADVMMRFAEFLTDVCGDSHPTFLSDNPAFDWQFVNWYFHRFIGRNPFGFSARRIGDLWAGHQNDMRAGNGWKNFRQRRHTHDPVDDVYGNAEAFLEMARRGLRIFGGSETVPPAG